MKQVFEDGHIFLVNDLKNTLPPGVKSVKIQENSLKIRGPPRGRGPGGNT